MKRRTLLFGTASLGLAACADAGPPVAVRPRPVSVSPVRPRSQVLGSYQHGRFTVTRDADGGQTVSGFAFRPPVVPAVDPRSLLRTGERQPIHLVLVDFQSKELQYYRFGSTVSRWQPELGFAILSPHARSLRQEVVVGRVTAIDERPAWVPPASIRRDYAAAGRPLPTSLPFGHPDNLMGAAKFLIDWGGVLPETVRLHGAVGYPATPLGEVETYGCVSLLDESILQLIGRIKAGRPVAAAVREGIVVVFHRRSAANENRG